MVQNIDNQTLSLARNPCEFPEGSIIQSIYTKKVYVITKHFKNGMCNLYQPSLRYNENWNACNNRHFVSVQTDLGIGCLTWFTTETIGTL